MNAIVLIGHGSVKQASGASMIRLATRLREREIVPIAEASFLNYSKPTLADSIARCADMGATNVTVQPYFLINGKYVSQKLPQAIADESRRYPGLNFQIRAAFNDHPALVALVLKRIEAALLRNSERADDEIAPEDSALLLMAHGTPFPDANAPIYNIAHQANQQLGYATAQVSFLDCNEPDIATAIDHLVACGVQRIVAMPYFLQFGRHVREDLPRLITDARQRHKHLELIQTHHLDYDLLLADVIADRMTG